MVIEVGRSFINFCVQHFDFTRRCLKCKFFEIFKLGGVCCKFIQSRFEVTYRLYLLIAQRSIIRDGKLHKLFILVSLNLSMIDLVRHRN